MESERWSDDPALRRSVVEGCFYALMVGLGEIYFVAAAVRLAASPLQLGLVVGLPLAAGGLGSMLSLVLLGRLKARKPVVLASVMMQVLGLGTMSILALRGALTPTLLILAACCHHAGGMSAGAAWSSWYGDLVPERIRGRFFAGRGRAVQATTCFGLIVGGLTLHQLESAPPGSAALSMVDDARLLGFGLLFGIAAASRLCSLGLLAVSDEPRFAGLGRADRMVRFLRTGKGDMAWRVLLIGAALQLVTYLAAPFFVPYMLQGLHFTYLEYMAATLVVVVAKVLVLPRWGRLLDDFGPRRAFGLAAVMVAVVPLPWLWAEGLGWVIVAQAFSGISWASYDVCFFTLLLDTSFRRTRPQLFASQSVLNGAAQFVGSTLGGILLAAASGQWVWIFALSLVLRLVVALSIPALVPRLGLGPRVRRRLALRLIGFRPHGGLAYRPVDRPSGDS